MRFLHCSKSFEKLPPVEFCCGVREECPRLSALNAEADMRFICLIKPDIKEFCEQYKTMTFLINFFKSNFLIEIHSLHDGFIAIFK